MKETILALAELPEERYTDTGTVLVLHDINTVEVLALPDIPALIYPGAMEFVAVRPIGGTSLRIFAAIAEHGRIRAVAVTATIIGRGCCHA